MPASYYAVSAKVHALYGRRVTGEDYRLLMQKKSIPEAAAFLQTLPGYHDRMSALGSGNISRETLENALRCTYVDEYQRIFSFMQLSDKELLRFPLYRAEQSAILTAMRLLTSTSPLEVLSEWSGYLLKKSSLDLVALQKLTCFGDIAQAAEHTIYGSALARIASTSEVPTHAFVDNMMQVIYFARLYKTLNQVYSGQTKKLIQQSLDLETDLLNIVQFLRLKQYFPEEDIRQYSFPLPCTAKLSKEYIQQLVAAPDYDTAYQMVLSGPYGSLFRTNASLGLEGYLYQIQYDFSRRQLRSANPTVYTPIAYLTLKEIELRNLISIIECIHYGVDPNAYVTLIGV